MDVRNSWLSIFRPGDLFNVENDIPEVCNNGWVNIGSEAHNLRHYKNIRLRRLSKDKDICDVIGTLPDGKSHTFIKGTKKDCKGFYLRCLQSIQKVF